MNETKIARVALVGLGPIGIEVARAVLARSEIEILGAADPAPDKVGKDLRELVSSKGGDGPFPIASSARELYQKSASERGRSDVVLLCTGSRLDSVAPQIEGAVAAGFHVVSTCEELSFPDLHHVALGRGRVRESREGESHTGRRCRQAPRPPPRKSRSGSVERGVRERRRRPQARPRRPVG